MTLGNRNEYGEIFVYFSQIKIYLRLWKKSAVLLIALPYVYHLFNKRYKYHN